MTPRCCCCQGHASVEEREFLLRIICQKMPAKSSVSPARHNVASGKNADVSPATIALYVPNLIGYFRLITGIAALYFAPFTQNKNENITYFLALYFVSYIADALDGTAARALNQTSKFGQVSR